MIKVCEYCGKTFETKSSRARYCNEPHYATCPVCGKQFKVKNHEVLSQILKGKKRGCSKKCQYELRSQATLKSCGTLAPGNTKEARAKAKQTMTERYGAPTTYQSEVLKDKVRETVKSKYGVDNVMQNSEVLSKALETQKNKHDGKLAFQTDEAAENRQKSIQQKYGSSKSFYKHIREKSTQTMYERYCAGYTTQVPEIYERQKQTMIDKYGSPCAFSIPEFREKSKITMLERYGVENASWSEELAKKAIKTEFAHNGKSRRVSSVNLKFASMLKENSIEFEMEKLVGKKWFDFYLPNRNLLIEIDPTYTHNTIGNKWCDGCAKDYQFSKTKIAEENGYSCIHVFDWDDVSKIFEMLKPKTKLYARNCQVEMISLADANKFLDQNHLQGSCRGQLHTYGLRFNDDLVAVMTFGKPRYNRKYQLELLRFCTRSDLQIIGGASKLFNFAIKYITPKSIISYCDRSKFNGNVYSKIGMTKTRETNPNLIWSKKEKYITQNLLNARGYDQLFGTSFGKGTSNEELMIDHGWLPVGDCGQLVFEWVA